jgi:hypothetical protein
MSLLCESEPDFIADSFAYSLEKTSSLSVNGDTVMQGSLLISGGLQFASNWRFVGGEGDFIVQQRISGIWENRSLGINTIVSPLDAAAEDAAAAAEDAADAAAAAAAADAPL